MTVFAADICVPGAFVSSIAHELNQPLTAIGIDVETGLQLLKAGNLSPDRLGVILTRVRDDAGRAARTLATLQVLATVVQSDAETFCLNGLVHDTVALLRHELRAREISVRTTLAIALPKVHFDRIILQRAVLGVLVEAMGLYATRCDVPREIELATYPGEDDCLELFIGLRRVREGDERVAQQHLPLYLAMVEQRGGRVVIGTGGKFGCSLALPVVRS